MQMHALIIRAQKAQEHLFRMDIGSGFDFIVFRVHLHLHPQGPTHSLCSGLIFSLNAFNG